MRGREERTETRSALAVKKQRSENANHATSNKPYRGCTVMSDDIVVLWNVTAGELERATRGGETRERASVLHVDERGEAGSE